jgi:hypothetical protein
MDHFELLETKRKHVKTYSDKIPPKELIENALWKAWKTSPSKNNAMAYEVLVWGPEQKLKKEAIHSLCVKNHIAVEDRAVDEGLMDKTQGGVANPYYEHVKNNPYLITIHSRLASPNLFYQKQVETGHYYDQAYQHEVERIVDSVAVEVGLFAANLTNYLLESGLDMSYNSCFKRQVEEWHSVGLYEVKQRPILMITCGYAKRYRMEDLIARGQKEWDTKPEPDKILRYI